MGARAGCWTAEFAVVVGLDLAAAAAALIVAPGAETEQQVAAVAAAAELAIDLNCLGLSAKEEMIESRAVAPSSEDSSLDYL